MKKIYKLLAVAFVGVFAVGCNDLDTEPLGSTITSDQKEEVLKNNPDMAEAGVNALPTGFRLIGYSQSLYNQRLDNDFGFSSINLGLDTRGNDLYGPNDGFNWYSAQADLKDWGGNYYANLIYWNTCYNVVQSANTVLAAIPADTESAQLAYYRAQALVFHATCFYYLVNMYQFTYAVNPDAPAVPVLTPENMVDAATNGNPCATVKEVWDLIKDYCTEAIALFEKAAPEYVRPDKRYASPCVAYGLRARANLITQNWSQAAADAQEAINLATAEGITPYSISEAQVPGFYSLSNHNYMWGVQNDASLGFTQGVVNFASHMGAWMPNGYCSVGTTRRISKKLYNLIPSTDARKNWWLDGNATIPATLPSAYAAYINQCRGQGSEFQPYMQVKFAAANNTPGTTSGATDQPMMRIEEMYLILAEAQGMQSPSTGAATLQNFVKQYRDPSYTCTAASPQDLQEAVWLQRRIELWGEGLAYFDLMRLQKGIDRRGEGVDAAWVYVVEPTDPVMTYQITQDEAETNALIGDVTRGMTWVAPKPVEDKE